MKTDCEWSPAIWADPWGSPEDTRTAAVTECGGILPPKIVEYGMQYYRYCPYCGKPRTIQPKKDIP